MPPAFRKLWCSAVCTSWIVFLLIMLMLESVDQFLYFFSLPLLEPISTDLIRPMKNVISFTINETPNPNEPVGLCIIKRASIAFWDVATRLQYVRVCQSMTTVNEFVTNPCRKLESPLSPHAGQGQRFASRTQTNTTLSTPSDPSPYQFIPSRLILHARSFPRSSFQSATNISASRITPPAASAFS